MWGREYVISYAESISEKIEEGISKEEMNTLLSRSIYNICKKNYYKQPTEEHSVREEHVGCDFRNLNAYWSNESVHI